MKALSKLRAHVIDERSYYWTKFMFLQILYLILTEKRGGSERVQLTNNLSFISSPW